MAGRGKQREAMEKDAAAQERLAGSQEKIADEQQQFFEFLKEQGVEDRATQLALFEMVKPIATELMGTYKPGKFAGVERPGRPDISQFFKRQYAGELSDIEDIQNKEIGEAADFYHSQGLQRTGVPGRGYGTIRAGGNQLRSDARSRLSDRLSEEKLAGFEDDLSAYYDKRSERAEDVNLSLAGTNILTGQQNTFNPNVSYGQAGGNLAVAGGSYAGSGAGFGNAARTRDAAARLPTKWSAIGGMLGTGARIGAGALTGGWSGALGAAGR